MTSALPFHSVGVQVFHISGRSEAARDAAPIADVAMVSPGFFHVVGLRLEAGRGLTDHDLTTAGTPKDVAVVNRAFARKYFPGENPLSHRLLSGDRKENYAIVGVVSDYRAMGVENGVRPQIFRPSLEFTAATLVVRSRGAPPSVEGALLDAARSVAPNVAADKVKTLEEYANYWTLQRKFNTLLLEIFASLALVLAVMGIYGVLSNLVTSRTREIGIRVAIGATPGAIGRLVLRQGMVPVGIGLMIGLGGSVAVGRLMGALLFQVHSWDPLTLTAAVAVIVVTSRLPSAVRRANRSVSDRRGASHGPSLRSWHRSGSVSSCPARPCPAPFGEVIDVLLLIRPDLCPSRSDHENDFTFLRRRATLFQPFDSALKGRHLVSVLALRVNPQRFGTRYCLPFFGKSLWWKLSAAQSDVISAQHY